MRDDTDNTLPAPEGVKRQNVVSPLPTQSAEFVDRVREFERLAEKLPQTRLDIDHVFHAGVYARTLVVPAGVTITGVEIGIPTVLVIAGDVTTVGDAGACRYTGYHVCTGHAGRKAIFHAHADTFLTMIFATSAQTVEQAEAEFTPEPERLASRRYAQ